MRIKCLPRRRETSPRDLAVLQRVTPTIDRHTWCALLSRIATDLDYKNQEYSATILPIIQTRRSPRVFASAMKSEYKKRREGIKYKPRDEGRGTGRFVPHPQYSRHSPFPRPSRILLTDGTGALKHGSGGCLTIQTTWIYGNKTYHNISADRLAKKSKKKKREMVALRTHPLPSKADRPHVDHVLFHDCRSVRGG